MGSDVTLQCPHQLVDIAEWPLDEEFAIFPVGSKPKRAAFCPEAAPQLFLIGGHRYLFKVSKDWRILQHWSEVIAYRLAQLCGIKAAPCFVATDSRAGEVGALVEFFYGHPAAPHGSRFVSGADLLRRLVEGYEFDPDRHHTVASILALNRLIEDRFTKWGSLLVFDALIGNTDRHPENWGILVHMLQNSRGYELAPSFDHGTSLAYQLRNDDIVCEFSAARIQIHLQRGRHHARWSQQKPERGHFELCRLFAQTYPQALPAMMRVLDFPIDRVEQAIGRCTGFALPQGVLTEARGAYLVKLIAARRELLIASLGA